MMVSIETITVSIIPIWVHPMTPRYLQYSQKTTTTEDKAENDGVEGVKFGRV